MKSRMMKSCCLLGVLLLACAGTLMAQDEPVFSASASVDYFNQYVWRGQNLDPESVIQFNMAGSAWGFTGAVWANMPLTGVNNGLVDTTKAGEFNEIDYSLDYTKTIPNNDKVNFSLGIIHYTFPGSAVDLYTTEIYGGLSFNVPLNPSVTWYRDIDAIDGSYVSFGVGHTFEKVGKWSDDEYVSLDISANIGVGGPGYNKGYFGNALDDDGNPERTKFNDFTFNFGVPFTLKHGVSITPSFHFSTLMAGSIRDAIDASHTLYGHDNSTGNAWYNGKHTNYWFGVNFTKSF